MKYCLFFSIILGGLAMCWAQSNLDPLQEYLRIKEYSQAIDWVDKNLSVFPDNLKHEALYLQSLAKFYAKDYSGCKSTLQKLLDFPIPLEECSVQKLYCQKSKDISSIWYYKAKFLLGQVYLKEQNFEHLENLYAEEAKRLLEKNRKDDAFLLYLDFAELFCQKPDAEDRDAVKPDYAKAYKFYNAALPLSPNVDKEEEIRFRMVELASLIPDRDLTIQTLGQYLERYDPKWKKEANPNFIKVGKKWALARYLLAEKNLEYYNSTARSILKELIPLLDKNDELHYKIRHDSRWLMVRIFDVPTPSNAEFFAAIESIQQYLQEFPNGTQSVLAAYYLAEIYKNHNFVQESIFAYQDFLEGKGFKIAENVALSEGEEAPAKVYERLRKDAMYELGKSYRLSKDYPQAIQIWQQYLKQFPDGKYWAEAQKAIIEAEYQIGENFLAQEKYEECQKFWQEFLQRYPLEKYNSNIIYIFGAIPHQFAQKLKEQLAQSTEAEQANLQEKIQDYYHKAIIEWEKLATQFPNSEETKKALLLQARIYKEEFKDAKQAIKIYERLRDTRSLEEMKKKEIAIDVEKSYRTVTTPKITLRTQNISKATVKLYRLNLEEYFRKHHSIDDIQSLDLALIQADQSWEVTIPNYKEYIRITQKIDIPLTKVGAYIVRVDDDEIDSSALLIWSDVDFVADFTKKEIYLSVQSCLDSKTASQSKVLLSDGEKIISQGLTDENGFYRYSFEENKIYNCQVFIEQNNHVASRRIAKDDLSSRFVMAKKGDIYTDRSLYALGDTVGISAILRDVENSDYAIPKTNKYFLKILNPSNICICNQELSLSPLGMIHYEWALSQLCQLGPYTIKIYPAEQEKEAFVTKFFACKWQPPAEKQAEKVSALLPKIVLSHSQLKYFFNSCIEFEIRSENFSQKEGIPIKLVVYASPKTPKILDSLTSKYFYRDIARKKVSESTLVTNEQGIAKADISLKEEGNYSVYAYTKDSSGNLISDNISIDILPLPELGIFCPKNILNVGEIVEIDINSLNLEGRGILTYESNDNRIIGSEFIDFKRGTNKHKVKIISQHYPQLRLAFSLLKENKYYSAKKLFTIERGLKIAIQSNATEYNSGEMAEFSIQTTDQLDKPVSTELSLALLDQELKKIKKENFPNIEEGFSLLSQSEYKILHSPLAQGWCVSSIITDESGKAILKKLMPKSAANWELWGVGCDNQGLFGYANITLKTKASVNSEESKNPVSPIGMEHREVFCGFTSTSNSIAFGSLGPCISKKLEIKLYPLTIDSMLKSFLGNIRQSNQKSTPTLSSLTSDLLAYSTALEFSASIESCELEQLKRTCQILANGLVAQKLTNGGWPYKATTKAPVVDAYQHQDQYQYNENEAYNDDYSEDDANLLVSARVLWTLIYAKKQGIFIDESVIKESVKYLEYSLAQVASEDQGSKALVQYVLSLAGKGNFAYANRLYRERGSMKPGALAYTGLLLYSLNKKDMANEVLEMLVKKNLDNTESPLENLSLALLASSTIAPHSDKETLLRLLFQKQNISGFDPYSSQGLAVHAISKYLAVKPQIYKPESWEIWVNKQSVCKNDAKSFLIWEVSDQTIEKQTLVDIGFHGTGYYAYIVSLSGILEKIPTPSQSPLEIKREYLYSQQKYQEKPISASSTTLIQEMIVGEVARVVLNIKKNKDTDLPKNFQNPWVIEEPIPYGMELLPETIQGNFDDYQIFSNKIYYFCSKEEEISIEHHLVGKIPGNVQILPTQILNAYTMKCLTWGIENNITILSHDQKPSIPYTFNNNERYELGRLYFKDKQYAAALEYLAALYSSDAEYFTKEVVQMLLAIRTRPEYYNAQKIVDYFEILKEKSPDSYIPFDQMFIVGQAYHDIREFERGYLVFQAIVDSYFEQEAKISGVLDDQGQFIASLQYMQWLFQHYPDSANVIQAYFGLTQTLYGKLDKLESIKNTWSLHDLKRVEKAPTRAEILQQSIDLLKQFLALYPQSEQAPQAAFSLASAHLSADSFKDVVKVSQQSVPLYTDSKYAPSLQYMEALGYFSQYDYEQAITKAKIVADGNSSDKLFATYILGQIYHAQGNVALAIEAYRKVKSEFSDAGEAAAYLERSYIRIPEITKLLPDQPVILELEHCNIQEAQFLVYPVDLLRLYMQKKNLSEITKIKLAGISPTVEKTVKISDTKYYGDRKDKISFDFKDIGAYLVICRGDQQFTSGLVLISPLEINVEEYVEQKLVRVNVRNVVENRLPKSVQVKVIGSENQNLVSGETDLRGIFVAENITGTATVIIREKNSYAFYRGQTYLGATLKGRRTSGRILLDKYDEEDIQYEAVPSAPMEQNLDYSPKVRSRGGDFRSNIEQSNRMMQEENEKKLYYQMRRETDGVQIEKAKK